MWIAWGVATVLVRSMVSIELIVETLVTESVVVVAPKRGLVIVVVEIEYVALLSFCSFV